MILILRLTLALTVGAAIYTIGYLATRHGAEWVTVAAVVAVILAYGAFIESRDR